jgi:hypothetical protein
MRYRLEVLKKGEIVVHNVETGLILGTVLPHYVDDPNDPDRRTVSGCTVLSDAGHELATISSLAVPNPLSKASIAVATYERYYSYPGIKAHAAGRCRPNRIENRLGTLLADVCTEVARGLIEFQTGSSKNCTKDECARLIGELHAIWYASRFGSFDERTRHVDDPYFCNLTSSDQISFAQAARVYGMNELRRRFPDAGDETLRDLLWWPLELLKSTLERLRPVAVSTSGTV